MVKHEADQPNTPRRYTIKDLLTIEVAPALGCTEPSAVALAAAAAASLLPDKDFTAIEIWLDPNIYKNSLAVTIPGAKGGSGIALAAALGAFGGDPALKLEVLAPIDDRALAQARAFLAAKKTHVNLLPDRQGIFIRARVAGPRRDAEAFIADVHDNIVALKLDGADLTEHPLLSVTAKTQNNVHQLEKWLTDISLEDLLALTDDLDSDDLKFLEEGVACNLKLADYGLRHGPGLGVGVALERLVREGLLKRDMMLAARILTSAASDARMAGAKLPAMSSSGSGNHGLVAVLPIWAVKDYLVVEDSARIMRAIALSHVITAYIKAHTGRLSAVCGCSIAAGAGAAGGIAHLMGGNIRHIAGAIKNLVEDLAGVICDGAKESCSLKLSTAAGTAVQSALFSLHGINVQSTDGIIARSPEQTMKNVGELSTQGMVETDRTILQIMIKKQFEEV
jgi:L-cysteine desulfidase